MTRAIHADGMHWNNLLKDAIATVAKCEQCMRYNIAKKGYHPLRSVTAEQPADHWAIDCAGPFDVSHRGNTFVLVMVDICTKFVLLTPIKDKTATTIAMCLANLFCDFGYPKVIQSDNGREFVNSIVQNLYKVTGIDARLTAPYHPSANGACERAVGIATRVIQKKIEGKARDWDLYTKAAQLEINCKPVRLHNSTPFELMFARRLNELKDYRNVQSHASTTRAMTKRKNIIRDMERLVFPAIAQRTKEVREAAQAAFNKKHRIVDIEPGTFVALINPTRASKLEARYTGPFKVVRRNAGGAYVLQDMTGKLLPSIYPPSQLKTVLVDPIEDEQHRYEVEAIIDHRADGKDYEYLTRWKGFDSSEDLWLKPSQFDDVNTIVRYWRKRGQPYNIPRKAISKRKNYDSAQDVPSRVAKRKRRN